MRIEDGPVCPAGKIGVTDDSRLFQACVPGLDVVAEIAGVIDQVAPAGGQPTAGVTSRPATAPASGA